MNSVTGAILILAAVVACKGHGDSELVSIPLGLIGMFYIIRDWVQAARRSGRGADEGE